MLSRSHRTASHSGASNKRRTPLGRRHDKTVQKRKTYKDINQKVSFMAIKHNLLKKASDTLKINKVWLTYSGEDHGEGIH